MPKSNAKAFKIKTKNKLKRNKAMSPKYAAYSARLQRYVDNRYSLNTKFAYCELIKYKLYMYTDIYIYIYALTARRTVIAKRVTKPPAALSLITVLRLAIVVRAMRASIVESVGATETNSSTHSHTLQLRGPVLQYSRRCEAIYICMYG